MSDENENKENESLIRKEDIIDLSENTAQREKLLQYAAILIGLLIIMIIHNFYSIGKLRTDKSLIMMQCPRQFDLDKPTLLEKVKNPVVIDNWIKSFSISYVMKMFPRAVEDAEPFVRYIKNHSDGYLERRYSARLDSIESIKEGIAQGNYSKFWIANSDKIQVRSVDGSPGVWVVLIDGYLHKKNKGSNFKAQPTIELTVKAVPSTVDNVEGLVVTNRIVRQIKDPVAGNVDTLDDF